MLTVVQSVFGSWSLSGVIYQGPNSSEDPKDDIAREPQWSGG
jgi:hypothetical protein